MRTFLLLWLVACSSSDADPKPDPCSAEGLRLGSAKPLTAFKLPAGCTTKDRPTPAVIASEADAAKYLDCKTKLVVDWKKNALVVSEASWSPAQIGIAAFDDGKKVTLVSKQRSPCKGDPQPMPTPAITSVFLGGTGARTFVQAACTVPTKCN